MGRAEKAEKVTGCLTTATWLVHRFLTVSSVKEAAQQMRWEVVCVSEKHSGQESLSVRPIACR